MQRHTENIHGNTLPTIKNNSTYNQPAFDMTQRQGCATHISTSSFQITLCTKAMKNRSYARTGRTAPLPSRIKQPNPNLASHTTEKLLNPLKIIHKTKNEKHELENIAVSIWGVVINVIHSLRT